MSESEDANLPTIGHDFKKEAIIANISKPSASIDLKDFIIIASSSLPKTLRAFF